jgi:hypothetical protein
MILSQFNEIYYRDEKLRYFFTTTINNTLKNVDYSCDKMYKREYDPVNDDIGVLMRIPTTEIYVWSWINTINTNSSCIYHIVDFINQNSEIKLTYDLYYKENELFKNIFTQKLNELKQIIFTRGSEIFTKMFFVTQNTWNIGLISIISSIYTISEHFKIATTINYNRGNKEDRNKGCDLEIFLSDKWNKTQHKKISYLNYDENQKIFTTRKFLYNERTYRNNLDLISIDDGMFIYLFKNSADPKMCGTNGNSDFFITENLLIKKMTKEKLEIENLLLELNRICFNKRMIFSFNKCESGENRFEQEDIHGTQTLSFYLNDINDKSLLTKIKNQIDKLK